MWQTSLAIEGLCLFTLGFYELVNDLKRTHPALRTLQFSVGGYGHDRAELLRVVDSIPAMQQFANSVIITLREAGFDGLDLSWLYPSRDGDNQLYAQWLKVMSPFNHSHSSSGKFLS